MNKNASSMYGVLSYQDFHELKDEFVKVAGTIEIHPAELEWLYNHHYYILKYRDIYQIYHSQNGGFYAYPIYKAGKPLTKRGRWSHSRAKEINSVLGFELLEEI